MRALGLLFFAIGAFLGNVGIAFGVTVFGLWPAILLATSLDVILYLLLKRL